MNRMEKLFDLLKLHCRKRYWFKDNDDLEIDTDSVCFHLYLKWERLFPIRVETVICKEFWFIKRLVEKDKINTNELEKIWYEKTVYMYDWQYREIVEYSDYESLLMLLSIQEEPISFLVSMLK